MKLIKIAVPLGLALTAWACGDNGSTTEPDVADAGPVAPAVHLDQGGVGVVLDTRPIFRAGYVPALARISFADHPVHDAELEVDALTNLAILSLENETLTAEEREAFEQGVMATVVIVDAGGVELAREELPTLVLDDSNAPLRLASALQPAAPSLTLRENHRYLLQPEDATGVMELSCSDCYEEMDYDPDNLNQKLYFTEVGTPGSQVYNVRNEHADFPGMVHWYMEGPFLGVRSEAAGGPENFFFEPDREGYVRIIHIPTGMYLARAATEITLSETGERFRIISDNIDWTVVDLGTHFNQPIMPPAQLDFAYSGRLSNCSSALLEETVGQSESRTSTTSISTSEGLELFSQRSSSSTVTNTTSVSASIGFEFAGIGGSSDVEYSTEESFTREFTTANTYSTDTTWARETSRTTEVSRSRTVSVPEYTIVDVNDAIKTVRNVRIPFTQVLRITGIDIVTEEPITGSEIATQLAANFVTGLVTEVGADYVEVSIRGEAAVDQMFNASTLVQEIAGGCQ